MYSVYAKVRETENTLGVKLRFSANSVTETNFDYLYIYFDDPDYGGTQSRSTNPITGEIGGREIIVPSLQFSIYWYTDGSVTKDGWTIEEATIVECDKNSIIAEYFPSYFTPVSGATTYTRYSLDNLPETAHPYSNSERLLWLYDLSNLGYSSEIEIYKDTLLTEENTLISPKLDLIEGNAGTFKFKMPPTNRGYNSMESLTTEIVVKRRGKEIWSGRIISVEEDFWKNKTITCEGELAYLNDTTQPQAEFHDITPYNFLTTLLSVHNSKAKSDKHFQTGAVTVTDPNDSLYRYTNYESTMKDINDKLVSRLGGYIHLRKVDGVRYIDYVAEENRPASSQVIQFGSNLLDFTKSYDSTEFCTVVLPLGARLENEDGTSQSDIEALEAYVTVESVNDGSPYIVNSETVNTFGWIEKVVNWDNVNQPSILLSKGKKYLEEVQFEDMVLEASAVDLGYLNVDAENINLSDKVRVISRPHGLDKFFPVTKISIPLDDPGNTTFTMGTDVKQSLSTKTVSGNSALIEKINNIPTESEILNNAKRNASNIIDAFTTGYITITADDYGSNELFVTDTKISTKEEALTKAERYWRWNLNGLGYYNKNDANYNNPSGLKLALTMDGAVNADFVTTGVLKAITIQNLGWGNGNDKFYANLETGVIKINATELSIGGSSASTEKFATSAATEAVKNLSGNTIYQKLSAANQGIYSYNGKFYINAEYIRSGIITIGGNGYGDGQLYVRNSSNVLTHQLSVNGFISYGTNTNVYYGIAGEFSDYDRITQYMDNSIAYRDKTTNTTYAYLGVNRNKDFRLYNFDKSISIYSYSGDVDIGSANGSTEVYGKNTRIYGNEQIYFRSDNSDGKIRFDNNNSGYSDTILIENAKVTFGADIYIDHSDTDRTIYLGERITIKYGRNNRYNLIDRINDSYDRFHGRLGDLYGGYWVIYDHDGNEHCLHIDNGLVFVDSTY